MSMALKWRLPTMGMIALAYSFSTSPAAAEGVSAYIARNGGCLILGKSWELEFQRTDDIRYGKAFQDWGPQDYQQLRSWILRCLDPWIATPGRVEVFMRNVDDRLRSFERARIRQNEIAANRLAAEARAQERKEQIAALDNRFASRAEIARVASNKFDQAAASFAANFKTGMSLPNIDGFDAEGRKLEELLVEAKQAIMAARVAATELQQQGGPQRLVPEPAQAQAFAERMRRIGAARTARDRCLPILQQAGIPRDFASTQLLAGSNEDDPFFFEVICPTSSETLQFIKPGLFSELYKLNLGRSVTATLWFELRQSSETTNSNLNNRLLIKRLRTKLTDISASSEWESANLMNGALVMLMFR